MIWEDSTNAKKREREKGKRAIKDLLAHQKRIQANQNLFAMHVEFSPPNYNFLTHTTKNIPPPICKIETKKEKKAPIVLKRNCPMSNYQNWIATTLFRSTKCIVMRQFAFETFVLLAFPLFYDGETPIHRHRLYLATSEIHD